MIPHKGSGSIFLLFKVKFAIVLMGQNNLMCVFGSSCQTRNHIFLYLEGGEILSQKCIKVFTQSKDASNVSVWSVSCVRPCLFCTTHADCVSLSPLFSQWCAGSANIQAGGQHHSSWKRDQKHPIPVCAVCLHLTCRQTARRDAHIPKPRWDAHCRHWREL